MWFFVSDPQPKTVITSDIIAYVPRQEGRGGIPGVETPMGSLNMTLSESVMHGTVCSTRFCVFLVLPMMAGSLTTDILTQKSQAY